MKKKISKLSTIQSLYLENEFRKIFKFLVSILAPALYVLYSVVDYFYVPNKFETLIYIRIGFLISSFLMYLFINKIKTFNGLQKLATIYGFIGGVAINLFIYLSGGFESHYAEGLNQVAVGIIAFLPFSDFYVLLNLFLIYTPFFIINLPYFTGQKIDPALFAVHVGSIFVVISLILFLKIILTRYRQNDLFSKLEMKEDLELRIQENLKLSQVMDYAYHIAHDAKSPLTALQIMTSTPEKHIEYQEIINEASEKIKKLLFEMRTISKSKIQNEQPQSVSALNFKEIIEKEVKEKLIEHSSKNIKITFQDTTKLNYSVKTHSLEFSRIISNLLNNSIEATDDIRINNIEITLKETISNIVVILKDTGKGIPREVLDKLLKKKFSYGKSEGNGIGLYHAYNTINNWGGNIEIQSTINLGTTITIKLNKLS